MVEFPGAEGGIVRLSFDPADWVEPNTVLIVPFYHGKILFTKHQHRGWELPGGTREPDEFPIQTTIRELYEETGGEAQAIEWIGQYCLLHPNRPEPMIKSIYVADIHRLHPLPQGFETEEIMLLDQLPNWQSVEIDDAFSYILKDGVYRHIVKKVKKHPFHFMGNKTLPQGPTKQES
ncbi:NUDIX domain-containing protein [Fodinisporobacter ferrooxydans]|uniref:NUDIX domain-containing protein n=1 Tax=Fodinisporobacter ferrooxydans TaxID=2901836 RepID=A0ABY4CRG1_9BACL|nr:NUDIX domain-containing protein [Alicyclobacillaceae bacterium MYW30-H2]